MGKSLEKFLDTWAVVWDWGKRALPASCSSGFGIFAVIPLNVLPLGRNFILPSSFSRKKTPFLVRAEMGFSSSQNVLKAGKWRNSERKIPKEFLIPDPFCLSLLPTPLAGKKNGWNLLYLRCFPPKKRRCNIALMLVSCLDTKRRILMDLLAKCGFSGWIWGISGQVFGIEMWLGQCSSSENVGKIPLIAPKMKIFQERSTESHQKKIHQGKILQKLLRWV